MSKHDDLLHPGASKVPAPRASRGKAPHTNVSAKEVFADGPGRAASFERRRAGRAVNEKLSAVWGDDQFIDTGADNYEIRRGVFGADPAWLKPVEARCSLVPGDCIDRRGVVVLRAPSGPVGGTAVYLRNATGVLAHASSSSGSKWARLVSDYLASGVSQRGVPPRKALRCAYREPTIPAPSPASPRAIFETVEWVSTLLAPQPSRVSSKDELLEQARRAVAEKPDDDAPRARFAKLARGAGQPERADLVEAQLRVAKKERRHGDSTRIRSLLATHGPDWAREDLGDELFQRVRGTWRRGFLEWIELDAPTLIEHADELFARVPVRGLRVTSLEGATMSALLSVKHLRGIKALSLRELAIDDDGARALASAAILGRLRWLDLSYNTIGDDGVRALIESPHLCDAGWVGLMDNPSRLPPRPGGRDGGLVLDTSWSNEVRERDHVPAWLLRNAELDVRIRCTRTVVAG